MLAEAFDDDPAFRHVFPDPARRPRDLAWFMGCVVRYVERAPEGLILDEPHEAERVAVTLAFEAPARFRYGPGRMLAAGFGAAIFRLAPRSLRRFWAAADENERQHDRAGLDRHLYLGFMGTVPAQQGRGHGSRLLRRFCEIADERGLPAYLENSNPANLGLYERFGFQTVLEWDLSDGGPPMQGMVRPGP